MVTAILSDETIPIHATNCFVRYNRAEGIINDSKIQTEYDSDYYKAWLNNFTDNTINEKHIKAYKNNYINIHGGGTIVHIDDFWKIGGYGESFFQWGCEDEDFHKKLSGVCICYKLGTIINQYNVLHLEHDLNWNNKMYLINNKLANNRKKLNVSDIVKIDLSMPNSFANAYINKNDSFLKKCILKAENFSEK